MEAAYVLTGSIERFEEVDQGRDVRAVCTISAQLMDAKTGCVIWNDAASETLRWSRGTWQASFRIACAKRPVRPETTYCCKFRKHHTRRGLGGALRRLEPNPIPDSPAGGPFGRESTSHCYRRVLRRRQG